MYNDYKTNKMIIVQLSDLHITVQGKKACNNAPTNDNLVSCVEHINQLNPPADITVVTGDITNEGSLEEAHQAAKILSKLNCPFYIVPGNHDHRESLHSAFNDTNCPSAMDEFIQYAIEDYEVRIIGIDSVQQGKSGGKFSKKRAKWLGECLSEDHDKPTIVFMHHPPVKCGVLETDIDGFKGSERLGNILVRHNNIEALLCGHIHTQAHTRWMNTVVTIAPPSTGMEIKLDLSLQKPSEYYLSSPNYLLHYWTPTSNLISHRIDITNVDGPYSFE